MKPVEDSPLDHMHVDNERSSFLNGSDGEPEDFDDLPPPPVFDSKSDPYLDYPDDNRTPTPPPSPGVSPFNPPRSVTPENGKSQGRVAWVQDVFAIMPFNPLNPNIKIQILVCLSLYIFNRSSGENLLKYQLDSSCVIMSSILMTTVFYKAVILQGEI